MDSEHRHELKENDLQEFLRHFGEWWGKHGNTILGTLLIAVLLFGGIKFYTSSKERKHEEQWSSLGLAASPDSYIAVADATENPTVRVLASLRGGDLLISQATNPTRTLDASSRAAKLTEAERLYQRVISDPAAAALFQLNAKLGLAAVAECRGDWTKAQDLYKDVEASAGQTYPALAAQAAGRAAMLDRVQQPVVFGPEPLPETQPADSAATQPAEPEEEAAASVDEVTPADEVGPPMPGK